MNLAKNNLKLKNLLGCLLHTKLLQYLRPIQEREIDCRRRRFLRKEYFLIFKLKLLPIHIDL